MPVLWLLIGALGGAGAMYLLDPKMGRRRRALMRDQVAAARHQAADEAGAAARDARNRAEGAVAGVETRLRAEPAGDTALEARVRSEIGRVVSNVGAIEVRAANGTVTLAGPVQADEHSRLVAAARAVPGVTRVEDHLRQQALRGDLPDAQDGGVSSRSDDVWG